MKMNENDLSRVIVDACYSIHTTTGPGIFESVYEEMLEYELKSRNLAVQRQLSVPVLWKGVKFDPGFRADLLVEDKVIIEVKSVEAIAPVHQKQLLTYLRLTDCKLGLLVNFNTALIKQGMQRIVNNF